MNLPTQVGNIKIFIRINLASPHPPTTFKKVAMVFNLVDLVTKSHKGYFWDVVSFNDYPLSFSLVP